MGYTAIEGADGKGRSDPALLLDGEVGPDLQDREGVVLSVDWPHLSPCIRFSGLKKALLLGLHTFFSYFVEVNQNTFHMTKRFLATLRYTTIVALVASFFVLS